MCIEKEITITNCESIVVEMSCQRSPTEVVDLDFTMCEYTSGKKVGNLSHTEMHR